MTLLLSSQDLAYALIVFRIGGNPCLFPPHVTRPNSVTLSVSITLTIDYGGDEEFFFTPGIGRQVLAC